MIFANRLGQGAQLLGRKAVLFLFRLTDIYDGLQHEAMKFIV